MPQTSVRPLDPGRLSGFCQHVRRRAVRPLSRRARRHARRCLKTVGRPTLTAAAADPRIREVYVPARSPAAPHRPRNRPAARPARWVGRSSTTETRRPSRAALRLAGEAGQPLLRPQLRQPRLGGVLRGRACRPGRRLLGHQPAVECPAARCPRGRFRRARLRHPPARTDRAQLSRPISDRRRRSRRTSTTAATSPVRCRGR